jgi:hypothetical protein
MGLTHSFLALYLTHRPSSLTSHLIDLKVPTQTHSLATRQLGNVSPSHAEEGNLVDIITSCFYGA